MRLTISSSIAVILANDVIFALLFYKAFIYLLINILKFLQDIHECISILSFYSDLRCNKLKTISADLLEGPGYKLSTL